MYVSQNDSLEFGHFIWVTKRTCIDSLLSVMKQLVTMIIRKTRSCTLPLINKTWIYKFSYSRYFLNDSTRHLSVIDNLRTRLQVYAIPIASLQKYVVVSNSSITRGSFHKDSRTTYTCNHMRSSCVKELELCIKVTIMRKELYGKGPCSFLGFFTSFC